jgi:hypothetical protein
MVDDVSLRAGNSEYDAHFNLDYRELASSRFAT